jgi:UDP-glucose 4-epimerase
MSQRKIILVTGGAGFIGSHLCARLVEDGHRVLSLDNYFSGSREAIVSGVDYREGSTKDIERHVSESIDCIYHLGEYARVEKSFEDIAQVRESNIVGTSAVLEFWRKRGPKLIYAGSSTKFADGGLGRDQSPYAWSKAANTELVRNYGDWFALPYAITYFYNVYGPGECSGSLGTVIGIFKALHDAGKPLTVVSPGTQKRNFTHVEDVVKGLVLVGERGHGDEYGLGARKSYSILEIAKMFGSEIKIIPERRGNRMGAAVDCTKSEQLGWRAQHSIRDYIEHLIHI